MWQITLGCAGPPVAASVLRLHLDLLEMQLRSALVTGLKVVLAPQQLHCAIASAPLLKHRRRAITLLRHRLCPRQQW